MTTTVRQWTGLEAKALRAALRMTMREFAGYLGVAARTIAKWEARGGDIQPLPETQAILDTALAKASSERCPGPLWCRSQRLARHQDYRCRYCLSSQRTQG